jgi:hypothetical protein
MRAAPCFFLPLSFVVGMSLANDISARNFRAAKLVVLLSDCKRESGSESG